MAAATHDILIEQGATFKLNLLWKDSSAVPINLTGYTARMQIRKRHADTAILLSFTTEDGGITLGGVAGTIAILGLATVTDDVTSRSGVYDLELVSGAGEVTRLIEGAVTFSPEVTR